LQLDFYKNLYSLFPFYHSAQTLVGSDGRSQPHTLPISWPQPDQLLSQTVSLNLACLKKTSAFRTTGLVFTNRLEAKAMATDVLINLARLEKCHTSLTVRMPTLSHKINWTNFEGAPSKKMIWK